MMARFNRVTSSDSSRSFGTKVSRSGAKTSIVRTIMEFVVDLISNIFSLIKRIIKSIVESVLNIFKSSGSSKSVEPSSSGSLINDYLKEYEQLKNGGGYVHTYVLNNEKGELIKYAEVYETATGRMMECWTTEPGVQLYTSSHFNGRQVGKGGIRYQKHAAFCLETQHYPDSPNQPQFPSTVLKPGDRYNSTSIYKFSTR